MRKVVIRTDGASKGNPGAAGIGVVVCDADGNVVKEIGEYIGSTTNNVAEYTALIRGLQEAIGLGADAVQVFTDSELLARQVAGAYKIKAPHLRDLHNTVRGLMSKFRQVSVSHVYREENAHADKLASDAANRGEPGVAGEQDDKQGVLF